MSWQRRHCIVCHTDMEHCATCGCHEPEPVATQANRTPARYTGSTTEAAPEQCANTAEGLTNTTTEES